MSFTFTMRLVDGPPADPPTFTSAIPDWRVGDDVRVGSEVRYRIVAIEVPPDDVNGVWIVEPVPSGHLADSQTA
jgi:hypothetical protein